MDLIADLSIYNNVPWGIDMPSSYTEEQPHAYNLSHISPESSGALRANHNRAFERSAFYSCSLPDGYAIAMAQKYPPRYNPIMEIEGLIGPEPGNPRVTYPWQTGLRKVLGCYIQTPDNSLVSVVDELKEYLYRVMKKDEMEEDFNIDVELYCYDSSRVPSQTALVFTLERRNNRRCYAVCIHTPKTLGDIAAMIHELGHVVAKESQKANYVNMSNVLTVDRDYTNATYEVRKSLYFLEQKKAVTPEERANALNTFFNSNGYRKLMGNEIIREIDAWSAAIEIIHKFGIERVTNPNSNDFTDYMWYCIKTRLTPPQLNS